MIRRILSVALMITAVLSVCCFVGCSDVSLPVPPVPSIVAPGDDDPTGEPNEPQARTVYLKINDSENAVHAFKADLAPGLGRVELYSLTVTLVGGDTVTVYDNADNTYINYGAEFDGTARLSGEYKFALRIDGESSAIAVTLPPSPEEPGTPDTPDTPETPENPETPDTPETPETPDITVPRDTKVTVYYTDSDGWGRVYAYLWNYATGAKKSAWPGVSLRSIGSSGFGEKQYSVEVDYAVYDRVIFNDGGANQTGDLVVGAATSGYYGKDGIFTMNTDEYGKVAYHTLTDAANLSYISGARKKISVYTPCDYDPGKKYGVLYMFDSQNLYAAAQGAQPSHDDYGSWAVDVAVTSMVKNGGSGVIVVAIDTTDGHRDQELTMSLSFGTLTSLGAPQYGDFRDGKLDMLGDFIKKTLMPWVASHYSVDTSRAKTGIAGSSSGGLAAYYLGLRDNELYGYIGAFSPANGLFTASDWTRFYRSKNFGKNTPKIYVYCGMHDNGLEDMLLPEVRRIKNLTSYGFAASDIIENYVDKATHSENFWRIAFTEFLSKTVCARS